MSYNLERQKTGSTPYIYIDEDKKYMRFEGESFHENVAGFYSEINEWLENYLNTEFETLTFDCELKYFNSSTAKLLLNILMEMDDYSVNGNMVVVNWITSEDNEIIVECGEDFKDEMFNLQFNLVIE